MSTRGERHHEYNANDVAAEQQKAAKNVADVRREASKDNASATDKVDDKSKVLNNVEATGAYDVTLARAEGKHKVALEKCNAVSGDAQSKSKTSRTLKSLTAAYRNVPFRAPVTTGRTQ